MPVSVHCPACRSKFAAGDHQQGKRVLCPKCKTPSVVPTLAKVKATCPHCRAACMISGANAKKPVLCPSCRKTFTLSKPAVPPAKPAVASAQIQARPAAAPVTPLTPVQPAGTPIVKRKLAGFPLPVVLGAGAGVLLLLAAVGVIASLALSGSSDATDLVAASDVSAKETSGGAAEKEKANESQTEKEKESPGTGPGQKSDPVKKSPPPKKKREPLPEKLSRETLKRVKDATVMFRVATSDGGLSEGSGFFCYEKGLVLTNAHVLGMKDRPNPPRRIEIVYRSGEPDSRTFVGNILAVDPVSDLAVLRVNADQLPPPLALAPTDELYETQTVYIFGFPLGSQLGKSITVAESAISSLRKDRTGRHLTKIQVNGGMHPGNSGGPVVNTRGEVVGVAVSIILGTSIHFAIPGDYVQKVLNGRVFQISVGPKRMPDGSTNFDFIITLINPLNRKLKVGVDAWIGNPGQPRPPTQTPPKPKPGDGPVQTVMLNCDGQRATGNVTLPALPAGKVYWLRPFYENSAGEKMWIQADPYTGNEGRGGGAFPGPGSGRVVLRRNDRLDPFGPRSPDGYPTKVYTLYMRVGRTYVIELFSRDFDPVLGVSDPIRGVLAADDDGGPGLNSRLVFRPQRSFNYRIIVSTYARDQSGSFQLIVREQ